MITLTRTSNRTYRANGIVMLVSQHNTLGLAFVWMNGKKHMFVQDEGTGIYCNDRCDMYLISGHTDASLTFTLHM